MDTDRCCRLINELTPRPGYKHQAEPNGDRCAVRLIQQGVHESAAFPTYGPVIGDLPRWYSIDPARLFDMADVTHALAGVYADFDSHETREFLRDRHGKAHCHPHTDEGRWNWTERGGRGRSDREPTEREVFEMVMEEMAGRAA